MALEGTWNGMALRLRRTQAGFSTTELHARLREEGYTVSPSSISRWEGKEGDHKSRTPANDDVIATIARILGCSTMAFYRTPIITYDATEPE